MPSLKYSIPVKAGLIAGGLSILWLLLWYFIRPSYMTSMWVLGATWIFYIGAMSYTGMKTAAESDTFQLVLRAIFVTFLVTNLLYYAFDLTMVRWVNPSIADFRKSETIRFYEQMGDAADVKEMLKQVRIADFKPTIGTTIFNYFRGAIGGFAIAFLLTFVVRKRLSMNDR